MSETIFKTISLHKPVWKRLWDYKIKKDADGLSHAVVILLDNDLRLKKIIEKRMSRIQNKKNKLKEDGDERNNLTN